MVKLPEFTPMQSSVFSGHHYDADKRELTVQYQHGAVWRYTDVPAERANAFAGAKSAGAYFNDRIKGLYPGTKL